MKFKAKPLRSELFVPGNKEDWMQKAPRFGADALILDLEDSVPPDEKARARGLVSKMLEVLGSAGQTLVVRVNRLETGLTRRRLGSHHLPAPIRRYPAESPGPGGSV